MRRSGYCRERESVTMLPTSPPAAAKRSYPSPVISFAQRSATALLGRAVCEEKPKPGMDGITALKQIRDDPSIKATPVVAVTASAMPMDRRKIATAGFDGYITKPISVKNFVEEVRAIIGDPVPAGGEESER